MKRILKIIIEIEEDDDRYGRVPNIKELLQEGVTLSAGYAMGNEEYSNAPHFDVLEATYGFRS